MEPLRFSSSSLQEIIKQEWDVIVVGAGHNGLTCAAYIAKMTKKRVLVLERSERIGGACTLKKWTTPKGELVISPCAYLASLLHPVVIEELELVKRGNFYHI